MREKKTDFKAHAKNVEKFISKNITKTIKNTTEKKHTIEN
jgi:hypothetical protein